MAQTGFTPIQLYSSPTSGAVPVAGNLTTGELAVNTADGKLFYKDAGGTAVRAIEQDSQSTYLTSVSGTNTITASLSPALTAYKAGQVFRFVAAGANTGAVTININSLGAKAITKSGTTALATGDIVANSTIIIIYDGTQFQLASGAGGGGASAGGVIYENSRTITSSYTMTTAKSGHTVGPLTVATGQTLTVPTGEALMIFSPSTSGTGTNDVLTTGAQTFQGQKTFALFPNITSGFSTVRLNTANGVGSTNTAIRRFATAVTNQGSDITYADSATLGATFTINTSGVYAISYSDIFSGAINIGISLNSTQLTTAIQSITAADRLCMTVGAAANFSITAATTVYLPAGSVIRAHTQVSPTTGTPDVVQFTITRVA